MGRDCGLKSMTESAGQHAESAKATGCCGASKNVVAKPGFRAHSEFKITPMNSHFPLAFRVLQTLLQP
jgi:hypothetical protein